MVSSLKLGDNMGKHSLVELATSLLESFDKLGVLAGKKADIADTVWMALACEVIDKLWTRLKGEPFDIRPKSFSSDEFKLIRSHLVELIDLAAS
jgi:hypothetical protein